METADGSVLKAFNSTIYGLHGGVRKLTTADLIRCPVAAYVPTCLLFFHISIFSVSPTNTSQKSGWAILMRASARNQLNSLFRQAMQLFPVCAGESLN
jgi:hypothetical protein